MKVKDICDLQNGRAFKPDDWETEGLPIVRIQNLNDESAPFNYYAGDYSSVHEINDGELLFSWSGTPGTSFGAFRWYRGKGILNQHIFKVLPKIDIDKEYLKYALNGNIDAIIAKAHGGVGLQHITKKELDEIDIPIVSKREQLAIVERIIHVERLIAMRKRELTLLDDLIRARFVEMFGDPRNNPKGWVEGPLSEKLNVLGGYAFKSDQFDEIGGIPVLRIGNINSGYFKPVNMVYWKEDRSLERYAMYPGDLVMSLTGTVGKDDYGNVCILGNDYEMYYLNQRNAKLELKDGLDKYYLVELMKFPQVKKKLTGISRGVRQANISNKDILNLVVPIPPIECQQQFADFVHQINKSKLTTPKLIFHTPQSTYNML